MTAYDPSPIKSDSKRSAALAGFNDIRHKRTRPKQTMNTATIEHDQRTIASGIGYVILGFIYAVVAYQLSASFAAFVIESTGVTYLIKLSILFQFVAGFLLSVIAYSCLSNNLVKVGMRLCYGLVVGSLFAFGAYTIFASLISV